MPSSRIDSILHSLSKIIDPIHIKGASTPVQALLVSRYFQILPKKMKPLVIICPNDDRAMEFCSDLKCIASTVDSERIKIRHFPTWEHSPYSSVTPSIKTRWARTGILAELTMENFLPDIIATTIAASSQTTMPHGVFCAGSIQLKVNESIPCRENLITHLIEAGYLRVDPVEDPGHFTVRGGIIDVFPPHSEMPYRIEILGDLIERIRKFNPITQRAQTEKGTGTLEKILLPPAREVLINSTSSTYLRACLKNLADHLGIPRAIRDPILSTIREGIYPDSCDSWAPFAYEKPETFWEYLPIHTPVIWMNEDRCQLEWKEFFSEQRNFFEDPSRSEQLCPPVESLFSWNSEMNALIQKKSKIYFDFFDFELQNMDPEKESPLHFTIDVSPNKNLIHGPHHSLVSIEAQLRTWLKENYKILILATTQSQLERIRFLLEERNLICQTEGPPTLTFITLKVGSISEGFRWPSEALSILTEYELLGTQPFKQKKMQSSFSGASAAQNWSQLQTLSDLFVGDTVVHLEHGIGRYQGLVRLDMLGAPSDFLLLEYAHHDKLYLPIYRLNVIQKYTGIIDDTALDRLGSHQFLKTKEKVKESLKLFAFDLVQLYAERKIQQGIRFSPRDSAFREFEAQFPFNETPDQLKAIDSVLSDMESGRIMDRLICGDVGYGKTEVAIRATFRAVSDGKQVAVLVPTTILAQQHEQSFKTRLKEYPFMIESVSRFKNLKEQRSILDALAQGKMDIIIGTHRLLSKDVHFHDLGLIIVDEEHRFGVEHKERLKSLKTNTSVLTLTATPIPRTLHMALSGLRDISLIHTPPINRLPIKTFISKYDEELIQRAIQFELARGGQVFFLHNQIRSIYKIARRIQEIVPSAQVTVAHGQMPENELEETMISFYKKKTNVLVCTTIIESGIDLPSANTIIINRADSLGLAQLYQIRGRVGRSQQRAYAYLLVPSEKIISENAKKKLEVIQRFVELGSGFNIASHDLEIRGGGELLGCQQSGNMAAVGFDLYTELLEEAIQETQGKPLLTERSKKEPEIKIPFPAFLSEEYIPNIHQRLSLYRQFSAANNENDLHQLEGELSDRFGNPPLEAQNLIWLIRIKIVLKRMGIMSLTVGSEKVSLSPGPDTRLDPLRAIALITSHPHQYQLTPDSRFIVKIQTTSLRDVFFGLEAIEKDFLNESSLE